MDNREFFEENGYLVVRDLFSTAEMDALMERVSAIESRSINYPERDLLWEPGNPLLLRNAFGLIHYEPLFRRIALDPRLVGVVEQLLGPDLDIYGDGLFAKPAREGSIVPPHQDMPYWTFEPPRMLTAWIALEDATTENGCLRVVPGSHRSGLLPHRLSGVAGNSRMVANESLADPAGEIAVELSKGSVGFHHCLTLHRSDPNRSHRSRHAYTIIYMTGEAQWTGETDYRLPFVHVRGKPSPAFESMKHVPLLPLK